MPKHVILEEMLAPVGHSLEAIPEHRTGSNIQYQLVGAGLSAFPVICLRSPSFLAHQRQMRKQPHTDDPTLDGPPSRAVALSLGESPPPANREGCLAGELVK